MNIDKDIVEKIDKELQRDVEKSQLLNLVKQVYEMELNVGHNQLVRCMLKLSKFQPGKFKLIIDSNFKGDPRDLILEANMKFKYLNYGLTNFPIK